MLKKMNRFFSLRKIEARGSKNNNKKKHKYTYFLSFRMYILNIIYCRTGEIFSSCFSHPTLFKRSMGKEN